MKRALVITCMVVLGLGFASLAQTFEVDWDTDFSILPMTGTFGSFDSDLDVFYSLAGWEFGMKSDFGTAGLDGLAFYADGALGAFTFDAEVGFTPLKLVGQTVKYEGLTLTSDNCISQTNSVKFLSSTTTNTYEPAFNYLEIDTGLSLAGVDLGWLFYLKGSDNVYSQTNGSYYFAGIPTQFSNTGIAIADGVIKTFETAKTATVGSGGRIYVGGSFGGATVESFTYFNMAEDFSADYYAFLNAIGYGPIVITLEDQLTMSGDYWLLCDGCDIFWSSEYFHVDGLSLFGNCLELDMGVLFTCCGFEWAKFLIQDIALGAWGVDLDFMVTFSTADKVMSLEPSISLAGACIDVKYDVVWADNTLTGIQIEGLSYSHVFSGATVGFAATWDYADNPLYSDDSLMTYSSAEKVYFFQPDTRVDGIAATATAGQYVLGSYACWKETATIFNKIWLDLDGDSCCGGLFDVTMATYFGEISHAELTGIYGTYYYATNPATSWTEVDFLGADNEYVDYTGNVAPTLSWKDPTVGVCDPCPADPFVAGDIKDSLKVYGAYATATNIDRVLGWVATQLDFSIDVGTAVTLTFGADFAWYGWSKIDLGITFDF